MAPKAETEQNVNFILEHDQLNLYIDFYFSYSLTFLVSSYIFMIFASEIFKEESWKLLHVVQISRSRNLLILIVSHSCHQQFTVTIECV